MFKFAFDDVFISVVLSLLVCSASIAAQPASVTITPASIDSKVKAGSSYTQTFNLVNNTGQLLRFRCSTEDVWFDEGNKRLSGRPGTLPRSASLWIQFAPTEIIVEPRSTAVVKAVITIPQTATGSFYAVPVFEASPVNRPAIQNAALSNAATASIGVRFRTMMMLTTDKGSEYNVEIMGSSITPPTGTKHLELNLDLRNRGTAHAKVRGAFAILDAAGRLAGRGAIEERRILPTQQKPFTGSWFGELKPGDYTGVVTLSYNRIGAEPVSLVQEIPFKVR